MNKNNQPTKEDVVEILSRLGLPMPEDKTRNWFTGEAFAFPRSSERDRFDAYLAGKYAGIQGANHKTDCPYQTRKFRLWWTHGCISGYETRKIIAMKQEILKLSLNNLVVQSHLDTLHKIY